MDRAYSLLQIKSFDDDQRILTGIASTVSPDRQGDIMESRGAEFHLPMPLLWMHNPREPIGHVTAAQVTDQGIAITAKLTRIEEPGPLRDRLNDAYLALKSGLVGALSIGWKPLEATRIKETFGLHVKRWLWVETSAVVVPANADATIALVKSLDQSALALSGTGVAIDVSHSSAAVEPRRVIRVITKDSATMKKSLTDQIKEWEATRQAKNAEINTLLEKTGDEGVIPEPGDKEKLKTLAGEVDEIDEHLVFLRASEQRNKAMAQPVKGTTIEEGSRSRGGLSTITVREPQLPPGIKFARMVMCKAKAWMDHVSPIEIAKQYYPGDTELQSVLSVSTPQLRELMKAAVAAGTTTDATWAAPLVQYQNYMGDFVEFLRPQTIIGKFGTGNIPSLRRVPFNIGVPGQTTGGTGYWVGQGQPKPVTKFDFDHRTLRWTKAAAITVLTEELIRFSSPSAEALVRQALADCIIARIDTDFIDPSHGETADVSPASITNGLTALTPSGTDADAVRTDIRAIFAPFLAANVTPTNGVWIMSHTTALALSLMRNAVGDPEFPGLTMNGGMFNGLPVITSQYASIATTSPRNELVVLVNASDIYVADDDQVTIDVSREASLQMLDNPTNSVATGSPLAPAPTSMVSLWQTDSVGLRAERYINWKKRRTAAAAYFSSVLWGTS